MAFQKLTATQYPRRQWALVGHPGSGKSTFASQMAAPLLIIDADHRFGEVAGLAAGDVYELSSNPADHVDAERIQELLQVNMPGSTIRTVVIDSLTAIIAPLVTTAVMENDAGVNKNRVAAFKTKALAMRLLQDGITGWGVDTLWVYHLRRGLDGQARQTESTSISAVELARLRRSLNLQLRVVEQNSKRGLAVDWARRGRDGFTVWDDTGSWVGMPERIEEAVYGGLSPAEMDRAEKATPTAFKGPADAIAWGFEQGCFRDAVHARNAYAEMKRKQMPANPAQCWTAWIAEVQGRVAAAKQEAG